MSSDPRHLLGARGEQLAAEHLERAGFRLLARNYRTRYGELDIVAADDRVLLFCEVKTRLAGGRAGPAGPLDGIGTAKRRRLRLMAAQWLASEAGRARALPPDLRFDAVGITLSGDGRLVALDHLEAAF